jgi:site-specific recombinase XerD
MNRLLANLRLSPQVEEGPLGPHLGSYAAHMLSVGYKRHPVCLKIRLVGGFSRWLGRKNIPAEAITAEHIVDYLRYRRRLGYVPGQQHASSLRRALEWLRGRDLIANPVTPPVITPVEQLLDQFDIYLRNERALAMATRRTYRLFVGKFLGHQFGTGQADLGRLCAPDVTGFVRRCAKTMNSRSAQMLTAALRSFLRFARYRGEVTLDLAACVPKVAHWSLSTLPKFLPGPQVEQVLARCERQTAMGRRDYAILMLLARLGLRAGEVVGLALDDIDWAQGYITVQSKGSRSSQLPLPEDVGQAIADYLRQGRPSVSSDRHVFLRTKAPIRSLKNNTVCNIVGNALARARIRSSRNGAHQFRHGLATEMLAHGASLREIGEVLRHQSPQTTTLYAKVDMAALRAVALPWPGGVR